jgi:diketogulonate reductase-like aldo/keto reductase
VRRLAEVCRILFEAGGSILDSSPMYGRAEAMAGRALAELGARDRAFIMTKVWTTGRQSGIRQMEESLRLFRTDRIELMQVHNLTDWRTQLRTLRAWKERGTFRYIGLTHYTTRALDELLDIGRREKVDFLQFPYSIELRAAERRLLPQARDAGIATISNVPFGQGGLFRRVRGAQPPAWAAEFGADSWARFFLKYVLGDPGLTCVIPGTGKPHHARDNVGGGVGRFPTEAERRRMVEAVADL